MAAKPLSTWEQTEFVWPHPTERPAYRYFSQTYGCNTCLMCAINNSVGEVTVTDADLLGTEEARTQNQTSRTGYGLKVLHQVVPGKEYRAGSMCLTWAGSVGWDSVIKVAAVVFQADGSSKLAVMPLSQQCEVKLSRSSIGRHS